MVDTPILPGLSALLSFLFPDAEEVPSKMHLQPRFQLSSTTDVQVEREKNPVSDHLAY